MVQLPKSGLLRRNLLSTWGILSCFFFLPSHHLSVDNTYFSITMVSYYAMSYFGTNGPNNAIQDMKKANI